MKLRAVQIYFDLIIATKRFIFLLLQILFNLKERFKDLDMILMLSMPNPLSFTQGNNLALSGERNIFLSEPFIDSLEVVFDQLGDFFILFAFLIDEEIDLPLIKHV